MIAQTPSPPYYAVIFVNVRTDVDEGYEKMAEAMEMLARQQPGFLGFESARATIGISISYWKDLASIAAWKNNTDHLLAQQKGRSTWYESFKVRIAKVEREYGMHL